LHWAAGEDLSERITYADPGVCLCLSSLFNVCLIQGKNPQQCTKTVIVPICTNKNDDMSDGSNYLFL